MKILVAIANFGTSNDVHMAEILRIYREMTHDVHVVVLSDIPRAFAADDGVEVIVGLPPDPRALPFGHKRIFAERIDDYDLFIYTEDDTPVYERTVDRYVQVSEALHDDEIAGFLRTETDPEGGIHYSSIHSYFHWVPGSVVRRGEFTFAEFTNDHSASYLLTRDQLRRAIASGGFLVEPHHGKYSLMVSAATDPYTQCGFRRLICISHLDDFITPHLPNKYIGRLGIPKADLDRQLRRLIEIQERPELHAPLLDVETKVRRARWSKYYYEHPKRELIEAVPPGTRSVLSIGCGWGATEAELIARGIAVTAIPLDAVIGAVAEAKGVEVVRGTLDRAPPELAGRSFDCLLVSNLLHVAPDPARLLAAYGPSVAPGGAVAVLTPNFHYVSQIKHRLLGHPDYGAVGDYGRTGVHRTTPGEVRRWLSRAGFPRTELRPAGKPPETLRKLRFGRLGAEFLSPDVVIVGRRSGDSSP